MKACICFLLVFCFHEVTSKCNETLACSTSDGIEEICFDGKCLTTIPSLTKENLEFLIQIKYPQGELNVSINIVLMNECFHIGPVIRSWSVIMD